MDRNWLSLFQCFFICLMIFCSIFVISNCQSKIDIERAKTKQNYNDLQKCIDACPIGWEKDKNCVDRCLTMEENK